MLNNKKNSQVFRWACVFLILIIADQLTKSLAEKIFRNYNFAFGLEINFYLMYAIYFLGIFAISFYLLKSFYLLLKLEKIGWLAIFAGGVANLTERLYFGYVRDWIYIYNGVFNLADGYIILGMLILFFDGSKNFKTQISDVQSR